MHIITRLVKEAKKGSRRASGKAWTLEDWTCFIVTAWEVVKIYVGSRKEETFSCRRTWPCGTASHATACSGGSWAGWSPNLLRDNSSVYGGR